MTPGELKTHLTNVLGNRIGTYTTPTGKTYSAIWIVGRLPDPSWQVSGLQVLILESPEIKNVLPLTSEKLKKSWWTVELTQHDVNQSLEPDVVAIENYFPVTAAIRRAQTRTDYEYARISIYDPMFTGPSRVFG